METEQQPSPGGPRLFSGLTMEQLLDQVPGAIWVADADLRLLAAFGKIPRTVARQLPLIGRTVQEIAGHSEGPPVSTHLRALHGEPASDRWHFMDRWYDLRVDALRGADGEITALVGSAVDVTETEEAQESVRRSLSLLEATLESTADGLLVVDLEGRIVAWNQRFAQLWRLPSAALEKEQDAALLSRVADQLVDPDQFLGGVRKLYAYPDEESLDVLRFRDGRVYERTSHPQRIEGKPVGRVWSFRDITRREQLLARTQLISDASRLLVSLDAESALTSVARLAVPVLGDACAVDLLMDGAPRRLVLAGEAEAPVEIPPPTLLGATFMDNAERSTLSAPLHVRGRMAGAITLVRLGTPYRAEELATLEELAIRSALALENAQLYKGAEEAVNLREEFISIAAHELRGPLASIRLAVQTLERDGADAAARKRLLELIDRQGRRLSRFVDDLLDVTRARAGRFHLELEEVDLAALVKEVCARMEHEQEHPLPPLSVRIERPVTGRWDRSRLDQVVTNLLSNAVKYGLGRPIELSLDVEGDQAVFRVRDHGIGVAPELRTKIFEPFERAAPNVHYGGLGLGLYIVRHIVTAMGGEVTASPAEGEGTVFTVRLPVR